MASVCFITNELFPLAPGGIGRMIWNYCMWNAAQDAPDDLHVLLIEAPWSERLHDDRLSVVRLHHAEGLGGLAAEQRSFLRGVAPGTARALLERGMVACNALEALYEREGLAFDFIEFPDFMGLATATIRRRLEGASALRRTRIVTRLHSSMTLIQADEGPTHAPSDWFAAVADIERYALRHSDIVVGHVPAVVDLNQAGFGFDAAWRERAMVEFPPIVFSEEERSLVAEAASARREANQESDAQTFVFSSRLQPFKRPDLFLRAAVAFLRTHRARRDRFLILSYGWDKTYIAWLESLIPEDLAHLIQLRTGVDARERTFLLARSIIVVPSTFESLCIFAYESYLMGATVILNGRCRAFSESPFWRDGVNCLLFDGDVSGLVAAMERALSFEPERGAEPPETRPYWREFRPARAPAAPVSVDFAATEVAVSPAAAKDMADTALETATRIGFRHVFLFRDRAYSQEPWEAAETDGVEMIDVWGSAPDQGALRRLLETSSAEYVVFASAWFAPTPAWRNNALAALAETAADLVAFTIASRHEACPLAPPLDWPNVLALGTERRVGAVAMRRTTALARLARVGAVEDNLIERLALDMALSDASAHVLNLPVLTPAPASPHRAPLHHYLCDALAAAHRRSLPQCAAYTAPPLKAYGKPYVDEWAVLPRHASADFDRLGASFAGVRAHDVRLRKPQFLSDGWRAEIVLDRTEIDSRPIGAQVVSVMVDGHRLELKMYGAEGETEFALRSDEAFVLAEVSEMSIAQLRVLRLVCEYVTLWFARSYAAYATVPSEAIENAVAIESGHLGRMLAAVIHNVVEK